MGLMHKIGDVFGLSQKVQPISIARHYFDTWYKVHDLVEMLNTFKTVLESGSDPMQEIQLNALRRAGLSNNFAAKSILEHLNKKVR